MLCIKKWFLLVSKKLKNVVRLLLKKLQDEEKPYKGIVAITRGGLFPAGLLAKNAQYHYG